MFKAVCSVCPIQASLGNFNTAVASLQLYPGIVYVAAVYKHDVVLILAEGIHATSSSQT